MCSISQNPKSFKHQICLPSAQSTEPLCIRWQFCNPLWHDERSSHPPSRPSAACCRGRERQWGQQGSLTADREQTCFRQLSKRSCPSWLPRDIGLAPIFEWFEYAFLQVPFSLLWEDYLQQLLASALHCTGPRQSSINCALGCRGSSPAWRQGIPRSTVMRHTTAHTILSAGAMHVRMASCRKSGRVT